MFNVWNVLLKQALIIVINMFIPLVNRGCAAEFRRMVTTQPLGTGEFSYRLNDGMAVPVYLKLSCCQNPFSLLVNNEKGANASLLVDKASAIQTANYETEAH